MGKTARKQSFEIALADTDEQNLRASYLT